jgi:hypothetical protein
MFNALDDSSQLITRNLNWSAHGLLLVNMTPQKSGILAAASSRAAERGKQPINNFAGLPRVIITDVQGRVRSLPESRA